MILTVFYIKILVSLHHTTNHFQIVRAAFSILRVSTTIMVVSARLTFPRNIHPTIIPPTKIPTYLAIFLTKGDPVVFPPEESPHKCLRFLVVVHLHLDDINCLEDKRSNR